MEGLRKPVLSSLVPLGLAIIFTAVGLGTPEWYKWEEQVDDFTSKVHIGLWEVCFTQKEKDPRFKGILCVSFDIDDLPSTFDVSWWKATRAMDIIGLCCLVIAAALIPAMIRDASSKAPLAGYIGAAFAAGVFLLIAIIIFAAKVKKIDGLDGIADLKFGFSWILSLLAALFAFATGGASIAALK